MSAVDKNWYLQLANNQYEWKASTQLVNETIVSSSFSEDLSDVVEKSLNRHKPRIRVNQKKVDTVSMGLFKKYLSVLLGYCRQNDKEEASNTNPLMMYDEQVYDATIYYYTCTV